MLNLQLYWPSKYPPALANNCGMDTVADKPADNCLLKDPWFWPTLSTKNYDANNHNKQTPQTPLSIHKSVVRARC